MIQYWDKKCWSVTITKLAPHPGVERGGERSLGPGPPWLLWLALLDGRRRLARQLAGVLARPGTGLSSWHVVRGPGGDWTSCPAPAGGLRARHGVGGVEASSSSSSSTSSSSCLALHQLLSGTGNMKVGLTGTDWADVYWPRRSSLQFAGGVEAPWLCLEVLVVVARHPRTSLPGPVGLPRHRFMPLTPRVDVSTRVPVISVPAE